MIIQIRSDALVVGDVVRNKCFQHAYWSDNRPDIAVIALTRDDVWSRGKPAGNPNRAKQWFVVEEIGPTAGHTSIFLRALTEHGARDPKGERLLVKVPGGALLMFKYWGRMNRDSTQIIYAIPAPKAR